MTANNAIAEESTAAKLLREAYVFGTGTGVGICNGIVDKVQNPLTTGAEVVTSYAVGYGLGRFGRRVPALQLVGLAFSYSLLKDVALRSESLGDVWRDTWRSGDNLEANQKAVQNTLGRFVVDMGVTSAVGGLGARRGAATGKLNDLFTTLEQRGFDSKCIATLRAVTSDKGVGYGSGFAIDDRRIVTAAHVLGDYTPYCVSAYGPKGLSEKTLKIIALDRVKDIAILESATPHGIKPLPIAETVPAIDTPVVAIGSRAASHWSGGKGYRTFVPKEGLFKGERSGSEALEEAAKKISLAQELLIRASLIPKRLLSRGSPVEGDRVTTWATNPLKSGMSGGPLLNLKTMEVIGISSSEIPPLLSTYGSAKDLRALMKQAGIKLGS